MPYVSASADDKEIAFCILAQTLSRWVPCHKQPPEVDLLLSVASPVAVRTSPDSSARLILPAETADCSRMSEEVSPDSLQHSPILVMRVTHVPACPECGILQIRAALGEIVQYRGDASVLSNMLMVQRHAAILTRCHHFLAPLSLSTSHGADTPLAPANPNPNALRWPRRVWGWLQW